MAEAGALALEHAPMPREEAEEASERGRLPLADAASHSRPRRFERLMGATWNLTVAWRCFHV